MQHDPEPRVFNRRIVLVTGELSGEIHAARLVEAIKNLLPVEFSGIGGARLREAGVKIVYDYANISLTGVSEIFVKLRYIREAYRTLRKHISEEKPSLVILVDFPGFNLKVARLAKRSGIPVIYFIPPQIWAWHESRIHKIKKYVDRVICILPFEKDIYDRYGIEAAYVGHPFTDTVKPRLGRKEFLEMAGVGETDTVVTIMPGSRENEFVKHMPVLLEVVEKLERRVPDLKVLLPLAESIDERVALDCIAGKAIIPLKGFSYDALSYCRVAVVASGSTTLEAAILGTPAIVVYKVSRISYLIAKALVKVSYISLPNIIMGREVFPEFIQDIHTEDIAEKALSMVKDGRKRLERDMIEMKQRLGSHDSYRLAGESVVQFLGRVYGTLS